MVDAPIQPWLYLPGANGNYFDTPNIAGYDLTADWGLTALVAVADYTGAAASLMALGVSAGIEGVAVWRGGDGKWHAHHGDGVTTRVVDFNDPGFVNGTTHLLRWEWDNSTPLVSMFIDGDAVAFDTDVPPNTDAGVGSGEDLHIGADVGGASGMFQGAIYYVELRDDAGADIARLGARDALAAVA